MNDLNKLFKRLVKVSDGRDIDLSLSRYDGRWGVYIRGETQRSDPFNAASAYGKLPAAIRDAIKQMEEK